MFVRRSPQLALFLTFFVLLFGFNASVTAGILKIETQTTVTVAGDLLKVQVRATNKGTEPAYDVQVHLILLGEEQSSPVKGQLNKDQAETVSFEKVLTGSKKGRYPLTVLVDFHDANQYPFSAVSCTTFYFKEDTNPDLVCLGDDISIEKNGLLRFKVKNLGSEPRNIRATLVLPKELSTPRPRIDLEIDPRSEKPVVFEITNFSALSGASYPVFCHLEYDLEDTHYTAIARAVLRIAKEENLFRRTRWLWITLTIILSAIFFITIIKGRKMKK